MLGLIPRIIRAAPAPNGRRRVGNVDPVTGAIWESSPDPAQPDTSVLLRRPDPLAPIASPAPAPSMELIPRQPIQPLPVPAEVAPPVIPRPPMIEYNNKGRPLGIAAESGGDPLAQNQALLEAQQSYKPKGSTKDLLLGLAAGFMRGGLPGVAMSGLNYAQNPGGMAQARMDQEIDRTQGNIQRDLIGRKTQSGLLDDQTNREYKEMLIKRTPNVQTQEAIDPATGNTVQMEYDPETKTYVPSKTANGPLITRTPKPPEKPDETVEINVGGQILRVKPDAALGYYGQLGRREDEQLGAQASAQAALSQAEQAAADHQQKVTQASAQVSSLRNELARLGEVSPDNPARLNLEAQIAKAEKLAQSEQDKLDGVSEEARKAKVALAKAPTSKGRKALDPVIEKRLRDAAKAKGLDPEVAIQRAMARQ